MLKSKKNTRSIMNNSGYGDIKIINKRGEELIVPRDWINGKGAIKKNRLQQVKMFVNKGR